ncbi:MAG: hypothetical protein ACXABV_08810 [Candidatus Thorarchaeota archaeon]|jgi:hypothetical protein
MGLELDFEAKGYIIHDRRSVPGDDMVRKAATDLADEILTGIKSLEISHTVMTTILFLMDEGAHLVLLTRSFDTDPVEKRLDSVLKRVTHDPVTGSLHTYVIPILERDEQNMGDDQQSTP